MGCYINPEPYGSEDAKSKWLEDHAVSILRREVNYDEISNMKGTRLLCRVSSLVWSAILVILTPNDYQEIMDERDLRQKRFYMAEDKDIVKVCSPEYRGHFTTEGDL